MRSRTNEADWRTHLTIGGRPGQLGGRLYLESKKFNNISFSYLQFAKMHLLQFAIIIINLLQNATMHFN